jgi:hypothetical protein
MFISFSWDRRPVSIPRFRKLSDEDIHLGEELINGEEIQLLGNRFRDLDRFSLMPKQWSCRLAHIQYYLPHLYYILFFASVIIYYFLKEIILYIVGETWSSWTISRGAS